MDCHDLTLSSLAMTIPLLPSLRGFAKAEAIHFTQTIKTAESCTESRNHKLYRMDCHSPKGLRNDGNNETLCNLPTSRNDSQIPQNLHTNKALKFQIL